MNPEAHVNYGPTPESLVLPAEYAFMSIDNMDQLRDGELDARIAQAQTISQSPSLGAILKADIDARATDPADIAAKAEQYVTERMNREDNEALFDSFVELVAGASIHSTTSEVWNNGERDDSGKSLGIETSGKDKHAATLIELLEAHTTTPDDAPDSSPDTDPVTDPDTGLDSDPDTSSDPDTDPDTNPDTDPDPDPDTDPIPPLPNPESVTAAEGHLITTRATLAKLSVQRRRSLRKSSNKARKLEAAFTKAQAAYETARIEVGKYDAQKWRHHGVKGTDLQANVVRSILDEHQNFSTAEKEQLTNDPSRRAKLARFFSNHNVMFHGANAAASFGTGFLLNKLMKGTTAKIAAVAGAAALPAAVTGFVAVKTSKAILHGSIGSRVRQNRSHDARAQQDNDHIAKTADNHVKADHDPEDMIKNGHKLLSGTITERNKKDIRSNQRNVAAAAAIGGILGGLGYFVGDQVGGDSHEKPSGGGSSNPGGESGGSGDSDSSGGSGDSGGETPTTNRGEVDGFNTRVTVERGEGYTQILQELADQKDINLTGSQSFKLYEHLNDKFNGDFLTNDSSYRMPDGNWGIDHPATTRWNPAVIHEINRWIEDHENHLDKD